MKIERITYKGIGGWRLTDGDLAATVTDYGAKIQSIRFGGKEMLVQSNSRSETYIISEYGDPFEKGEFSGFDQMFPNVSAGIYPAEPWKDVELPDHGEVWSRMWESSTDRGALCLRTAGVRLPYELRMRIRMRDNEIEINYHAGNLSGHDMDYIWCCHAQFILEDGMRLIPDDAAEIFNAAGGQKYLGAYGEIHGWPVSGDGRDLRTLSSENRCCNKYWIWNALSRNRCTLEYPDGRRVVLTAPVDKVPYLGVWTDECGYGGYGMRCAAPEPATAAPDSLEAARRYQRMSILPAGGCDDWWLKISFTKE